MNLLTKLFIVLLVVCSLLMTAAMVVFVSRAENSLDLRAPDEERDLVKKQLVDRTAEVVQLQIQLSEQAKQFNDNLGRTQADLATANKAITAEQQKTQDVKNDLARAVALQETAGKNLDNAQAAIKQKDADIAALRTTGDTLQRQIGELNEALTKKLKEYDWVSRQLRASEERLADALQRLAAAEKLLTANHIKPTEVVPPSGPLVGVIESVVAVPPGTAAEISLGSDQQVVKGMKFVVSDAEGNFLAELVIVEVQPLKSTGMLNGPRVADVKKGMKVSTPTT